MELTYEGIKQWYTERKYPFNVRPYELNLLGLRNNYTATDAWDDTLAVAYSDGRTNHVLVFNKFTTDPGYFFLKTKILNPKGCAFVKEGFYQNLWTIGLHNNKYKALIQYGKVTVYRDGNKDNTLDRKVEDTGYFGINLHHGYGSAVIFNNSAGCQVLRNMEDLGKLLVLVELHEKTYGKGIDYALTSKTI